MTKEAATAQPIPPPTKSSSATATLQADTTITTIPNPKRRKSSRTVKNLVKSAKQPLKTAKNTISNSVSKNTVKITGKLTNKLKTNGKLTLKNSKQNSSKIITKKTTISTPRTSSNSSSINAPHNRQTASLIVNEFLTIKKTKITKKSSSSSSSSSRKRKQSNSTFESSLHAVESKQLKRAGTPSCSELECDSAFMGNSTSLPNADSREPHSRDSESPSFQEIPSSDQENRPRTRSAKVKGIRPSYYDTNPPLSARQRAALGINSTKQTQPFNALNTPSPQSSLPQTGTFSLDSPPYQQGSSNFPNSENSVFTSPTTNGSTASPDLISGNHQTTPSSTLNRTSSRFSKLCGFNSPCGNSNGRKNKDARKSDKNFANGKNKNNKNKESQHPSSPSVLKTQHSHLLKNSVERPHCIYPDEHFWLPNEEVPSRLEELDRAPIMDHDEALSKAWNDNDSSQNIIVIDNGYTLHRHPVAQSTDAIRGKMSYSSGMHAIEFVWEHGQRGTHAVLGVCTKSMRLERPGYCSLIGNDANGWGWDITRNRLFHNGHMVRAGSNLPITTERENGNSGRSQTRSQTARQNTENIVTQAVAAATHAAHAIHSDGIKKETKTPSNLSSGENGEKNPGSHGFYKNNKNKQKNKQYPQGNSESFYNQSLISDFENGDDATAFYPHGSEDFVIPARIIMIIDCDEGWVGFCSEGKWLGIAFSTLKRSVTRNGVRRLPGALYPCISCVWGNCEVSMKPLSSISAKSLSLNDICRKSLWRAAGGPARGFYSTEQMCRIINYEEHRSGLIPDKLKRYLLAPTKHSLPSKILSDEFCRGELYYRQYYSPMKSIESNTESSTELQEILEQEFMSGSPTLPRSADTPTPPELPESENSNTNVKTKKYNLRSRKHRENKLGGDDVNAKDKIYTQLASIKSPNQTENALGNELKNQIDAQCDHSIEENIESISQNSGSRLGRIAKQRGSKKKNKAKVSESVNPIAKKNRTNK
jgi:hypothetical protein